MRRIVQVVLLLLLTHPAVAQTPLSLQQLIDRLGGSIGEVAEYQDLLRLSTHIELSDIRSYSIDDVPSGFIAKTRLNGASAHLYVQRVTRSDGQVGLLYGLHSSVVRLHDVIPGVPESVLALPGVLLSFDSFNSHAELAWDQLLEPIKALHQPYRESPHSSITVGRGMSFAADWPLSALPDLVVSKLDLDASSTIVMRGSIDLTLSEVFQRERLNEVGFFLEGVLPLPGTDISILPEGFTDVRMESLSFTVGYAEPSPIIALELMFQTTINGTRQRATSSLSTWLGRNPQSINMVIALSEPWDAPFGLSGITLTNASVEVTMHRTARVESRVVGEVRIGQTKALGVVQTAFGGGQREVDLSVSVDRLSINDFWHFAERRLGMSAAREMPMPITEIIDAQLSMSAGKGRELALAGTVVIELGSPVSASVSLIHANNAGSRAELNLSDLRPQQWRVLLQDHLHIDPELLGFLAELPDLKSASVSISRQPGATPVLIASGSLQGRWVDALSIPGLILDGTQLEVHQGGFAGDNISLSGSMQIGDLSFTGFADVRKRRDGVAVSVGASDMPDLSLSQLNRFFSQHFDDLPLPHDMPVDLHITDPEFSLDFGRRKSVTIAGVSGVAGLRAPFLLSAVKSKQRKASFLAALKFSQVSVTDIVPTVSQLRDLRFPELALVLAKSNGRVTGRGLSAAAISYFEPILGANPSGILPGVQFMGGLKLSDGALREVPAALQKLGMDIDRVNFTGVVPAAIFGGNDRVSSLALTAELPNMRPASSSSWLRGGSVQLLLNAGVGDLGVGLRGVMGVNLHDEALDFGIEAAIDLGKGAAIKLSGDIQSVNGQWHAPFGIEWLTMREVKLGMTFNPMQQAIGFEILGDMDVGGKNLFANVGTNINYFTGVPTEVLIHGKSTTPFGTDDLLSLQEELSKAIGAPVRIPREVVPELQISPLDANTPMELLIDVSTTGLPAVALKGGLNVGLSSNLPTERIGNVDIDVSATRIKMKGDLNIRGTRLAAVDLDLGPRGLYFESGTNLPYAGSVVRIVADGARCGYETVHDGSVCGFDTVDRFFKENVAECGQEAITSSAVCGTEVVTDGSRCGYETIRDGSRCGFDTVERFFSNNVAECGQEVVTSGALCGTRMVTSGAQCGYNIIEKKLENLGRDIWGAISGTRVERVREAKSCRVNNTCFRANSCTKQVRQAKSCDDLSRPRSCRVNSTCFQARSCSKPVQVARSCEDLSRPKSCDIDTRVSGGVETRFGVTINNRGLKGSASGTFCLDDSRCQSIEAGSVSVTSDGLRLCAQLPPIGQQCAVIGG